LKKFDQKKAFRGALLGSGKKNLEKKCEKIFIPKKASMGALLGQSKKQILTKILKKNRGP
tara:strand:- start:456 stop:635 length:180 start_codon:yes stop_codon:yes gene_type:complete